MFGDGCFFDLLTSGGILRWIPLIYNCVKYKMTAIRLARHKRLEKGIMANLGALFQTIF